MKKIIFKTIAVLSLGLLLTSCFKDLDVQQKNKITASNMWLNEDDAEGACTGMFYQFRSTYESITAYWGEYRAGTFTDGMATGTFSKLYLNSLDATETKGTNWASSYTLINDANLIIKHVPDIEFSNQDDKDRILASAHYVRAYAYYQLARVFGDVPILLSGFESADDDLQPSRQDVALVYKQVGSDIATALSLMPQGQGDCITCNVNAINMLKADYSLWMYATRGGGQEALKDASDALDCVLSSSAGLLDNYADVFSIRNKNNKEIIHAIHFQKDELAKWYCYLYLVPKSRFTGNSSHWEVDVPIMTSDDQRAVFAPWLVDLLKSDPSDTRTNTSYREWVDPDDGAKYTWVHKFAGLWEDNERYFICDLPIYRYAETLMFKAELEMYKGNLGEAVKYLNMVAERAYKAENYYPVPASDDEFKDILLDEYLKEFCAESKSWWNFVRLGRAFTNIETLKGRQNETNLLLWPITNACMKENPNIRQTVGY